MYYVELVGTAVFAITGVLAVARRGLDVVGALALGMVTAVGGGTLRDLLIGQPVFWFGDVNHVWAALAGALAAFWIGHVFRSTMRILLYLDAVGAALFAIAGASKVLALGLPAPVAVLMGLLTGIGGGLIRDVLAGRETLLMSREIYATPILIGCTLFVVLLPLTPGTTWASSAGIVTIVLVRSLALHRHWDMPAWLTQRH
ncbi:MAG: TRIC cation channel family protein [Vicinamibacterales bacterium]